MVGGSLAGDDELEDRGDEFARSAGPNDGPDVEVRLLGGLRVLLDGEPVALPYGAVSTVVAFVALRRAVHLDELTDVLWPDAEPEVARRRVRNVFVRIRHAAGAIIVRSGDQVELAAKVIVDHHELERTARQALATASGPARVVALETAIDADGGSLLPAFLYEDWTRTERVRARERLEDLRRALAAELEVQ